MNVTTNIPGTSPDSRQALIEAMEAFIAREGLGRAAFGKAALGDASLLARLDRGTDLRVATADRVLAFMGRPPLGPIFRREVEAFLGVTRTKPHLLGEEAIGDPSFVMRLRRGRSPRLATVDRVRAWMAGETSAAQRKVIRAAAADGVAVPPEGICNNSREKMMETTYMTTRDVAAFLGLSPRTLDRYRVSGDGPVFHRFGNRVRYLREHVEKWAAARQMRSTSDENPSDRDTDPDEDDGSSGRKT